MLFFYRRARALAVAVLIIAAGRIWGAAYVWTPLAGGTYDWDSPTNWNPSSSYPAGEADVATFNNNIAGNQTINLNRVISTGVLNLGSANNFRSFTVVANTGFLFFDNGESPTGAQLNVTGPVTHTVSGPVTLFSILTVQTTNGFLNLPGNISGQGALIREGSGNVTLGGTNSYAGGTFLNSGSLTISADSNLGQTGTALTFGGTGGGLQITADLTTSRNIVISNRADIFPQGHNVTLAGSISGAGLLRLNNSGGGKVSLAGANSYGGGTVIDDFIKVSVSADNNLGAAGTALTMGSGSFLETTATFSTSRPIFLPGFSAGSSIFMVAGGTTFTENGIIGDGSGGSGAKLVIQGGGTVVLSGMNTYRGGTSIVESTLSVSSDANLGAPSGALDLNNGKLQTTASFVTSRNVTLTYPPALEVAAGTTLEITGAISGSNLNGSFTKLGGGTLTLSGTSTYTTPTRVQGGTLIVNGSVPSAMTVIGGILGGSGTTGAVLVIGGSTLSPGTGAGILNVAGNLTMSLSSTYLVDLNGAALGTGYDQANVAGAVDLGNATLSMSLGFVPTPGASFIIINNDGSDSVIGAFNGLGEAAKFTVGGQSFVVTYAGGSGNDVVLIAVPEPQTLPFASAAIAALVFRRRRK